MRRLRSRGPRRPATAARPSRATPPSRRPERRPARGPPVRSAARSPGSPTAPPTRSRSRPTTPSATAPASSASAAVTPDRQRDRIALPPAGARSGARLAVRCRPTSGAFSTPWSPGVAGIRDVQIGGLAGVPSDADAVVLNVTVVSPTAGSFLQLWPTGSTQPVFGSSLNFVKDQIVPNAVTVKLGTARQGPGVQRRGQHQRDHRRVRLLRLGRGRRRLHRPHPRSGCSTRRPVPTNVGAFSTPWSPAWPASVTCRSAVSPGCRPTPTRWC